MNAWIDTIGDVETLPNWFCLGFTPLTKGDDTTWIYEISDRRNDGPLMVSVLRSGYFRRMYGFNNLSFDYPIIHRAVELIDAGTPALQICANLKLFATEIIENGKRGGPSWIHRVHYRDELVKQVDLRLIHHFDNKNRMTSLKTLQMNMRARRVQEMPFHHTKVLTHAEMDIGLDYNRNDLFSTKKFAWETMEMIGFREQLGERHLNDNDTKIGKSFFTKALEERSPGICFDKVNGRRQPRQTWRNSVALADVIFPWIRFDNPEPNAVLETLKAKVLNPLEIEAGELKSAKVETKGVFKNLKASVDGFTMVFGTGGLHGSVTRRAVVADAIYEIVDVDVEAFYPSIAIEWGLYPAHLGPLFVEVYRELKAQRVAAKAIKDMVKSDALKLANNGVYGDSNNMHGPFYDPQYTMAITVNGQLMLVMLAERFLAAVPSLEILQVNTDGMTLKFPRVMRAQFDAVCDWWQSVTQMKLEKLHYGRMFIRDVNSYIGEYNMDAINKDEAGKRKRKGAYDFELKVGKQKAWHKDHSMLVIPRAADAALCDDHDPTDFIHRHPDQWDFLARAKVTGQSRLILGDGTECQQTTRYYVSPAGQPIFKLMPPTAKKPDEWRRFALFAELLATCYGPKGDFRCSQCGEHGPRFKYKYEFEEHAEFHHTRKVKVQDVYDGEHIPDIDYDHYIAETNKLLF